jgi:hypothetical protein
LETTPIWPSRALPVVDRFIFFIRVSEDVIDTICSVAITLFSGTALQPLELGLFRFLRWFCPNQFEILFVETFIFTLAFFPSTLLPLAPSLTPGFFVFFVFVNDKALRNLGHLTSQNMRLRWL